MVLAGSVYDLSAGGAGAEVEDLEQVLLGGVAVGEHAPGLGPAAGGGVDHDCFLDPGEGVQELADGHAEPGLGGLAAHEVGDGQGKHAVEGVHADLLVGPVEHRAEGDDAGVLELAEAGFGVGLGAVGGDDLGGGPVVAVGEQDPLAEVLGFQGLAGLLVGVPGQAEASRPAAGERGLQDPAGPARGQDAGDLGFDLVAGPAGVAAGQPGGQGGELALGLGEGLGGAAGLPVVEGGRVGQVTRRGPPSACAVVS